MLLRIYNYTFLLTLSRSLFLSLSPIFRGVGVGFDEESSLTSQRVLSLLAEVPNIHVIASINNINAPLSMDNTSYYLLI